MSMDAARQRAISLRVLAEAMSMDGRLFVCVEHELCFGRIVCGM
ncbi:MAG: hypothetical protein SPD11_10220 [Sphaerochaetaceae bacterium]|nr:hypothetical protein [Sphaerochaetaceae bacterium]